MLALHSRRVYCVLNHILIRNLRTRKADKLGPNPGLDKRFQAFRKEGIQIQDEDAEEFIEQSESDFYNVGESYSSHLNETLMGKHKLRHHIVKEKYFKENMPNLLTWSEKEQIRHLATTNPNEWTPEKIAESFPVTAAVVKKLLKYPWKPSSEQRIARHDSSAMRNWRELKEGTLNIPDDLRQHFLKFSERTIPPLNKKSIKPDIVQEKEMGEFERIVQRCAVTEENKDSECSFENIETDNSSCKIKRKDNRLITLDDLKSNIKDKIDDGQNVEISDQLIAKSVNNISEMASKDQQIKLHTENKNHKELAEYHDNESDSKPVIYPERIRIPKKAYKRDATYRVNDCFYDHDGKFLYRVLGVLN